MTNTLIPLTIFFVLPIVIHLAAKAADRKIHSINARKGWVKRLG